MWGYRVPNGTWTGMLGDLQRNESELAVGPFLITTVIDEEFTFGSVFLVDNLRFLAGLKQPFFSAVFTRVSPFDIELWVLVGLTLLLLSYLSVKLVRSPRIQHAKGFLRTYGDIFFIYFAATMQKHSPTEHVGGGAVFRALHCLWLVGSFFAMNFFTASMRADLLVKVEAPRVRTTDDVLRNPDTRILLFGTAGFTELFLYTNEDSYSAVYDQVRRTGGELHPSEIYTDKNFRDVLARKAVMLQEEKGTMEDQIRRNCPAYMGRGFFYFSEESLGLLVMSWVTRKDFDAIIHREMKYRVRWLVDTGMVQLFMRDVSPGPTACWLQERHKSDMDGRMLEFEDLESVFVLYALLLQLALAAFILECLGPALSRCNSRFCPKRRHF
ncbi:glutamate receptor-like [Rhipicephalus sanguineus]|nr:glutamate receptor-like [Rhipicephalus sanguineus]